MEEVAMNTQVRLSGCDDALYALEQRVQVQVNIDPAAISTVVQEWANEYGLQPCRVVIDGSICRILYHDENWTSCQYQIQI
jgi:hypothetical protein